MERDSSVMWIESTSSPLHGVIVRYRPDDKTMTAFACLPACLHFHK